MTYRDDHDAAIARADALEDEVERVEHERDELAAKVKALEAAGQPKPAPVPVPEPAPPRTKAAVDRDEEKRKERKAKWIITGVLIAILGGAALWGFMSDRARDDDVAGWEAETAAYNAYRDRWSQLIGVEPCVRKVASSAAEVRRYQHVDPRTDKPSWMYNTQLIADCLDGARALIKDPKTSAQARGALEAWIAVQRDIVKPAKALYAYYSHRDWHDDDLGGAPALWSPVLQLLDRQAAVLARVRRESVPAIDAEIAALQAAHEKASGRDKLWWRIELARKLRVMVETAMAAGGIDDGKLLDEVAAGAALRDQAAAFRDRVKQAPIEARRLVREIDAMIDALAAGQPLTGTTLLQLVQIDGDLLTTSGVPALPPKPGKRPSRR